MTGLDAAGKTSILYSLTRGQIVTEIPTVGFNVEKAKAQNFDFTVFDVDRKETAQWDQYFVDTDAVIFVVDAHDSDRFIEAKEALKWIRKREGMQNVLILVYANKQDLPGAVTKEKLTNVLELTEGASSQSWYVQESSVKEERGIKNGLEWITETFAD
eukprot:CAMPEP_0168510964 /NCGR_PEP_ID=MMETSP0405-20121227/1804_1 /TAXON_ID=498012 /ORGANISM="Trichosphaerium sp, Strain Am-I-7 wt" /LENGTH=157 /DNA_ID=CAMNT_0008528953 /DNA_START=125 /DNA_END=598 /DNA_ORIENTATION=-